MKSDDLPDTSGSEVLERSRRHALVCFISILCAGISVLNIACFAFFGLSAAILLYGAYLPLYLLLWFLCRRGAVRFTADTLVILYISNASLSTLFMFPQSYGFHFYLLIIPAVVWLLFPRKGALKYIYSASAIVLFFICEFGKLPSAVIETSEYGRFFFGLNLLVFTGEFMISIRFYSSFIRQDNSHLSTLASTDSLTGLKNRRFLDETGEMDFREMRRDEKDLSIIMLDLDHFKAVNDSWGHDAGDRVLEALGGVLKKAFRSADKVCRYGGEEFLVLLKGTGPRDSLRIAEELRRKIEAMDFPDYPDLKITASLGVAHMEKDETGLKEIIIRADKALYYAKAGGRNCVKDDQNNSIALLTM
ncbi:MAG: GGDEF domain-containing protein [Spirochaetales bacterium]|nr:GGDEF domain-containing protein [Spirochaetales bacterium]